MTSPPDSRSSPTPPPVSLPELIAFCRELAALARARVPLGVGLQEGAFASGSGMDRLAARLLAHEQEGRSLPEALDAESGAWPAALRAIVLAGLASGRLPEALEAVARSAQAQYDVRRRIGASLIYPAILLVTASWLVAFVAGRLMAGVEGIYASGVSDPPAWIAGIARAARAEWIWSLAIPGVVVVAMGAWIVRSRSSATVNAVLPVPLRWLPGLRGLVGNLRMATLSDLLSMLLAQGVPLPQALQLAGDSTGHAPTATALRDASAAVAQGIALDAALAREALPPMFPGIVASAGHSGALPEALAQLAAMYHRRADRQAEWVRELTPAIVTLLIGTGIVLCYAGFLLGPVARMIFDLVQESNV